LRGAVAGRTLRGVATVASQDDEPSVLVVATVA
jgi:hypothetical protein